MSFSTITKSPLFFVGLPFVILLGILFFGLSFMDGNGNGNGKNKIKIKPVISVENDLSDCLESDQVITARILNPTNNKEFTTNQEIDLKGQIDFKCKDLLNSNEYKINPTWYLNDEKDPISNKLNYKLSNLPAGSHTLSLEVEIVIEFFDDLNTGATAEFKIKDQQVLGVTPTPPVFVPTVTPTPTSVPNTPPTATISAPRDGQSFVISNYCYINIGVSGTGADQEDGALTGGSLQWSYTNPAGVRSNFDTGTSGTLTISTTYNRTPQIYNIHLVATDSDGATNQKSIKITVDSSNCIILY